MKYIIAFISIALIVSIFSNWYQNRLIDNMKVDPNFEVKALIRGLQDEQVKMSAVINERLGRDTIYNHEVKIIERNFTKLYEKIDTAFDLNPIVDSILAEDRRTPFERYYKVGR